MTSVRGNIFRFIMRTTNNINPFSHPDAVKRMRTMAEPYINDKMPKGYTLEKLRTQNGVDYQRIRKNGAKRTDKVIYFLHGGAYISGLIDMYRTFTADFCSIDDGIEIVLLDYKLAPEYKYPSQLNEAEELWSELTEKQGYRSKNIIIGGDSSGGNLALALMLKLRDEGKEMPLGAFLISPWCDMTASGDSYIYNYNNDVEMGEKRARVTQEKLDKILASDLYCYLGSADRTNPYVSPIYGDYRGFPPILFAVGDHEMLLDDTLKVVDKLKKASVPVICERKPKMFHTYVLMKNYMPESKESYDRIVAFIRDLYDNSRRV